MDGAKADQAAIAMTDTSASGAAEIRPSSPHERLAAAAAHPAPPCTLVIFGAHGDLTRRLLTPALYNLAGSHLLDDGFRIVGVDRVEDSTAGWTANLAEAMQAFTRDPSAEFYVPEVNQTTWGWMAARLSYVQADFTKPEDMRRLAGAIQGSAVFYLAVAGRFFGTLVDALGEAGLLKEDGQGADLAFRRVVIEKPFGADLASARALNAQVLARASERQIFRIDHFLGKETVQNIMALRFANGIFEPLWRRDHIDYIEITAAETVGVERRGSFYEPTGALRDMVPNHLFQLLAMVGMEPPNSFEAEAVRNAKEQFLAAVQPVRPEDAVRGQYAGGTLQGREAQGYREETDVAADSTTETYVAMRVMVENWRWAGVPFYLRTGKRLALRRTEVVVHFRSAPYTLFRDTEVDHLPRNHLVVAIQPVQGLRFSLSGKVPGPRMELGNINMRFRYEDAFEKIPNVGYETLIYDCLLGDATLFQRADTIEAGWCAVEPLLAAWADHSHAPDPYPAGSNGPAAADALLAGAGHSWRRLE